MDKPAAGYYTCRPLDPLRELLTLIMFHRAVATAVVFSFAVCVAAANWEEDETIRTAVDPLLYMFKGEKLRVLIVGNSGNHPDPLFVTRKLT